MAAKLTAQAVLDLLNKCSAPVEMQEPVIKCIVNFYAFNPDAIEAHRQDILDLLLELPEQFLLSKGGGWSFLQAAYDKHEVHWGEHCDMEALIALGIAADLAMFLLPREMWGILPGGMPYLVIKDTHS